MKKLKCPKCNRELTRMLKSKNPRIFMYVCDEHGE